MAVKNIYPWIKVKAEKQFRFEVNELSWNSENDLFFITNGQGFIEVLSWPELEIQHIVQVKGYIVNSKVLMVCSVITFLGLEGCYCRKCQA